jgi:hypothetical protein
MNPGERGVGIGRLGGRAVSAAAAAPFAYLWVQMMANADDPLSFRARLDMAIGMAVFATPWVIAAGAAVAGLVAAGRRQAGHPGRPGVAAGGRGGDAAR